MRPAVLTLRRANERALPPPRPAQLSGEGHDVSPHRIEVRSGAREEWNAGTLLAFHPASAGHGLNLQHGGSRMAWLSPSWSAELTEQTIARLYRPGQTRHVTVHVCVVAETVDEMKRDRLIGKISAQEAFRRHLEQV